MLSAAACGHEPLPGEVDVALVSPSGHDGAALIEFVGAFDDVRPSPGVVVFSHTGGTTTRVVAVRASAGTITFRMFVPDVHRPPEGTILQVAASDNSRRASLAGYRLIVERVDQ